MDEGIRMSMEFANRICPNCKNPNYMVSLGDFSKAYKYKCMNCNRYFNDIDFGEPLQPVWIKEQEAVEPTRINTNYEQHWNCGNCNAVISVQDKYCHECGKRIEWKGR